MQTSQRIEHIDHPRKPRRPRKSWKDRRGSKKVSQYRIVSM